MTSPIKVGIIGQGRSGWSIHAEFLRTVPELFKIEAVADLIPERVAQSAAELGCRAYHDAESLIADPDIDLVVVSTYNATHAKYAEMALRAGKHVLCEKPAARTYADALEMQQAQHETGKVLNIGVVNRFNASVRKIRELIEAGTLGDVYHVYASFRAQRSIPGIGGPFTTKAIAGGGALIDWGVHFLDIVMFCLGDPEPLTVSGRAFSKLGKDMKNYVYHKMWSEMTKDVENGTYDVDDSVTAFVRTAGPTITLNGAWAQNIGIGEMYIDFLGDKAGIRLTYGGNFTMWGTSDGGALTEETFKFGENKMFQNEIDSFLRCIRTGEKLPSHIDKNILTSKLMQAIYDSSEQDREIDLR